LVVEERDVQGITEPAPPGILSADKEIEEPDLDLVVEDEIIIAEEGAFVQDTLEFAMESEAIADNSGGEDELGLEVLITGEEFVTETTPAATMTSRSSIAQPIAADDRVLESSAKKQAAGSPEKGMTADSPVLDSIPAMPVGGTESFNQYIERNKRFPEEDILTARGTVIMSFVVDQQGRPGNIEIIETPGDAFSREAVRLLQEGPNWTPVIINGAPTDKKIRLSLEFQRETP
jgi:hypothetical protein